MSKINKIYEEDKYLLKNQGDFLKWINEHLSVILSEIEMSKTKREREMICTDLYKIQKVISRRIKMESKRMKIKAVAILNEDNPEFFAELLKEGVDAVEPEMEKQLKNTEKKHEKQQTNN